MERRWNRTGDANVVIVGAGLGGLCAALRLGHSGRRVDVFERHLSPGGKIRTTPSVAGPVDAGPTVLTLRGVFDALFEDVGLCLSEHVGLAAEPILARHSWPDGAKLDLLADPEACAAELHNFAGIQSAREFQKFRSCAHRLFEAFDLPIIQASAPSVSRLSFRVARTPALLKAMAPGASLAKSLANHFSDPRLRQLFGRYATYVGGSPYRSPAVLALIWEAEARGVWRVSGGMYNLARAIEAAAASFGVAFHYGADVSEIVTSPEGVRGVRLVDGTFLPAGAVLFNGEPAALAEGLLGAKCRAAVQHSHTHPRSHSAFVWSFSGRPEGFPLAHHNVFFCANPEREFDDLAKGRAPTDPTLYVCAQDRCADGEPVDAERFEIIMNGPPTDRNGEVEKEAEICTRRALDALSGMGLTFREEPSPEALTTPQDFSRLFPGSMGSLYGRAPHGLLSTFKRPRARTTIGGLYLAGGGTHPGPGVPMAALSGRNAAEAILSDRAST